MKEKKILLSLVMVMFLLLFWGAGISHAISGVCSNCHTMHNSQDGAGEVKTYTQATGELATGGETPQDMLLKASCIACHTGTTGATDTITYAPIVLHTSDPDGQGYNKTLAGGDFYWVADGLGNTDSKGHNVAGISSEDVAIGKTPPGFDTTATPGVLGDGSMNAGVATWSNQLTCAGQYGCHGNHSDTDPDAAISGAHHGNTDLTATQASNPTTVGGSYRFLGGINGLENSEWNWNETASIHNEYYGSNGNDDYSNKRTISYSCAQCHGDFHSTDGIGRTASPWIRHPTDIALPNKTEYASYTAYSVEAPVARSTVLTTSNATVTPGTNDIVMCMSCHRAHGSPEPDILRWTYTGMVAGSGTSDTGCFTCHTTKNAS